MRASLFSPVILFSFVLLSRAQEATDPVPPNPRTFHRAITLKNEIFVLGGTDLNTHESSKQIGRFDFKKRKWSSENIPLEDHMILLPAAVDDKLYIYQPGGSLLHRYDPIKKTWAKLRSPSVQRPHSAMAAFEGKLILIGGYDAENKITRENSVEIYDPETNSWTMGPPLPDYETTDHFHLTAVLNGKLHVVGHFLQGKSHWVFDGKSWSKKAEAPVPCGWKSAALEAIGGKLILIQPDLENKNSGNAVFTYDPKLDQWGVTGKVPQGYPFILAANASANGKIYVFGGHPMPSKMFVYDVASKTWQTSS